MYDAEVSWKKKDVDPFSNQGHPDYNHNLLNAKSFCARVQKSLQPGMMTYICDSHHMKKVLLTVTFSPPRNALMGNFGTHIFLHQPKSEVNKQIEAVFNSYLKMAKEFWDKYNKNQQGELLNATNK